jgi:predicted DNA-binding protein
MTTVTAQWEKKNAMICARVPQSLDDWLREQAARDDRSKSYLVTKIIVEHIHRLNDSATRRQGKTCRTLSERTA